MTLAKSPIEQVEPSAPPKSLPTMYDLPSEHPEDGLPDEFHLWQAELCNFTFCPPNYPPERVLTASDLYLYYDPQHTRWYKRPDWFAVVGVPHLYQDRELRLSYVVWQEKVSPIVALEFLSPSTQAEDLGQTKPKGAQPTKWRVYEQILAIPHYIVFSRYTDELRWFRLENGRYQEQVLSEPRIWLPELELGLGLWRGEYRGLTRQWLRWYDKTGTWIPTEAEQEHQRAEHLAEQNRAALQEKDAALQEKDAALQEKNAALQEKNAALQEKDAALQEKNAALQEKNAALQEKDAALQEKELIVKRAALLAERLQQLGIDPNEI